MVHDGDADRFRVLRRPARPAPAAARLVAVLAVLAFGGEEGDSIDALPLAAAAETHAAVMILRQRQRAVDDVLRGGEIENEIGSLSLDRPENDHVPDFGEGGLFW